MPKMKTKRSAAKRFKLTGSGKVKINKAKRRHILTKKSTKLKRHMRQGGLAADVDVPSIKRMIPYA
ncbi:MAG: large subunit ribosomal protein L35 [Myxococcota bacterium]|jgi:large subunit ribosomal protein L35